MSTTKELPLVSIVIPSYNSGSTITRAIESALSQTYRKIELIMIDDGSEDGTIDIINAFTDKDARIELIRQTHSGPNRARQRGVMRAHGKYIMFMDADDYLEEDAVERLVGAFAQYNVENIRFNCCYDNTGRLVNQISKKTKIIDKKEALKLLLTSYALNPLWSQVYNAEMLKKIAAFHLDYRLGEDFLVNLEVHQKIDRVLILSGEPLYHYCTNMESTTRSRNRKILRKNIVERIKVSCIALKVARQNRVDYYREAFRFQVNAVMVTVKQYIKVLFLHQKRFRGRK